MALSLDDYSPTTTAGYSSGATFAAALTKVCHCIAGLPANGSGFVQSHSQAGQRNGDPSKLSSPHVLES